VITFKRYPSFIQCCFFEQTSQQHSRRLLHRASTQPLHRALTQPLHRASAQPLHRQARQLIRRPLCQVLQIAQQQLHRISALRHLRWQGQQGRIYRTARLFFRHMSIEH
jgi:hypothetical protein